MKLVTYNLKLKMKAIFLLLSLCVISYTIQATGVHAQNTANCDVCGYCKGVVPTPPYKNPPSDWLKCAQCVYPELNIQSKEDYSQNKTLAEGIAPNKDRSFTALGCLKTKPGEFVGELSNKLFGLMGGISFLFLLYGAFLVTTSRGDYERLNQGKKVIYGAIAGLIFVLFAVFIIRFLAVNVFQIQGFK